MSQFTITFLEHRRSDTNETMRIVTRVIIKASVYVMMLKDFIRTNIQGQGLHDYPNYDNVTSNNDIGMTTGALSLLCSFS